MRPFCARAQTQPVLHPQVGVGLSPPDVEDVDVVLRVHADREVDGVIATFVGYGIVGGSVDAHVLCRCRLQGVVPTWFFRSASSFLYWHGTERVMPTEGKNCLQPRFAGSTAAVFTGVAPVLTLATSLLATAIEEFSDFT
jgi:hypothetical protein